ncbi:hypothetical protein D3C73_1369660 [compost metagenome]
MHAVSHRKQRIDRLHPARNQLQRECSGAGCQLEDQKNDDNEASRLVKPGYNRLNNPHESQTRYKGKQEEQRYALHFQVKAVEQQKRCQQGLNQAHARECQRPADKAVEPRRTFYGGITQRDNERTDQCAYE